MIDISTLPSMRDQSLGVLGMVACMCTVAINCANKYSRKGALVRVYTSKGNETLAIQTAKRTFIPPSFHAMLQSLTVEDAIVVLTKGSNIGVTRAIAVCNSSDCF